ncbi:Fe-S protein assembly chaperone HscA [Pokkaliibacter sp. MBI-7]|uniref:Fe-S protein assembly chaperone HscA n=1 Tax=Pokkaliibacter sp. MBI-7 TaxID=3040600 RepID=UPI00244AC94E|nr:Fe-S protein assembly chaperone HscA [Pokkaliibacter sp. MBI-7]MDH2432855.1 Fe-S protein assembly chaperone HscA [Pokkaliibacter sp. MBI-7]
MLLQISEPGQSPQPHQSKRAVGIDLGTTNSLVATVRSGERVTLADEQGRDIVPSIVRYAETGIEVGEVARAAMAIDSENTLSSIKRLMGRGVADVDSSTLAYQLEASDSGMPYVRTRAGLVSPVQVSAEILKTLAMRARASLGGELDGVVITVPAYFDDAQRQATKDAARLAGLQVLRLLNEPTAAAVAYGLDEQAEGIIAVYDLGGGTFDISILRLHKGVFEVMATGGDSALGGDDFDMAIARWAVTQWQLPETELSGRDWRLLLQSACAAKEQLAQHEEVQLQPALPGIESTLVLTRQQMSYLLDGLVQRTLRACRKVLRDAGISAQEVKDVVMVGGSTRTLYVREQVAVFFDRQPLTSIDPDKVVALGAAAQADILVGNKRDADMLLLDVIPLSLGLETMGGLVERVIDRNTVIPAARAQEFTTFRDGQTAMMIHVVQGERELVSDCRSLARFELRGIPPLAAGAARIRVTFQVDADGLLSVAAEELSTGVSSSVVVKPSYGLSEDEIGSMLKASYQFAEVDMAARALREQQVEADRLLEALDSALEADQALLSAAELQAMREGMTQLLTLRQQTQDHTALSAAIEALSQSTDYFAARRMDRSIRDALAGHRVDEF